jgi:hypothetical protein
VPSKIRPGDWDYLFAPNAPRRGGPLRALVSALIAIVIITLVSAGAVFGLRYRAKQVADQIATATAVAPTTQALQTQAAAPVSAGTATREAQRTATALARQATPAPAFTATVAHGGNVREKPVSGNPIDQIKEGETVQLLAKTPDGTWYQIKNIRNKTGWASQTLLTIDPAIAEQVPVAR